MLRKGRTIALRALEGFKTTLSESSSIAVGVGCRSAAVTTRHTNLNLVATTNHWRQTIRSQWTDGRGYTHFKSRSPFQVQLDPRDQRRQRRSSTMLLVFVTAGGLIYVSSRQEIPYTHRKHAILVDIETEKEMGAEAFEQVISQAKAQRALLPQYHPASLAVKRVGSRIAAVADDGFGGGFIEHMKGLQWEFAVIQSPQVNAFVVPGGKVVVYTGLLKMLSNEDELAAVLAHEASHVIARHAAERMTQGSIIELLRFLAYIVLGIPIPGGLMSAAFFLPNSRKAETEADAIGIQLAARSCYDPSAAASVFQKLGDAEKKMGGGAIPKFLRTHPVTTDRVRDINQMLATAKNLYITSGCGDKKGLLAEFQETLGARIRPVDWNIIHRSV